MTEYGLAFINSDPSFTAAATPQLVEPSRWSAPENMNLSRKGNTLPESKPADVYAFAMLMVETFSGAVPFGNLKSEMVVLRVLRGGRPERPRNAQAVGLTDEMWKLLQRCWQQDPDKRPTMEEVVRRWQKFVGRNNDGNNMDTECVHP